MDADDVLCVCGYGVVCQECKAVLVRERDAARAEVKALTAALNIESTNYMNEVARADRAVADLDAARAVAKVCDCWKRDTRAALDADPTP